MQSYSGAEPANFDGLLCLEVNTGDGFYLPNEFFKNACVVISPLRTDE